VCRNSDTRAELLRTASCVLYTPSNEHFGIVPVEAMCCGAPVVAVNSGEELSKRDGMLGSRKCAEQSKPDRSLPFLRFPLASAPSCWCARSHRPKLYTVHTADGTKGQAHTLEVDFSKLEYSTGRRVPAPPRKGRCWKEKSHQYDS